MAEISKKASVLRMTELGGRDATVLEHESLRVMVDDIGSIVPELSLINGKQRLNAHWLPWFRSNSGKPWRDSEDGAFWKASLLYNIAGNFPCVPNFGPGHKIDGLDIPPHGWTANLPWLFRSGGTDGETGALWALSVMDSPEKAMPLSFKKIDAIVPGQNVHYISVTIKNTGSADLEICAGWHNTLGAPFLAEGCRISGAASAWATAPLGSEFDATTRLIPAAEFSSLKEAPLSAGGKTDLSRVPGPLGYTDFVSGGIDSSVSLGWSSLVNPGLKAVYICFFTGPASAGEDDLIFRFNNLWMQYGGRPFKPWAPYDGGTDLTYCLGTENAAAAWAQGLEYSRKIGKVLGTPTTVIVPAGKQKVMRYGCLFAPYEGPVLDEGVVSLEAEANNLVSAGNGGICRFAADPSFTILKGLEKRIT
jgi:hypothetical protein